MLTRRDFLRTSAMLSAGAALASCSGVAGSSGGGGKTKLNLSWWGGSDRNKRTNEVIKLYELLAPLERADDFAWALPHELAWSAWRERRFQEALSGFQELQKRRPDDAVVALYVKRCERALQQPPPDDWEGVFNDLE